jgi:chemotaxis-related protein WspB
MLAVIFKAGSNSYGLDARDVIELAPFSTLHKIPGAPPCVAGLLNFHKLSVPVIDLNELLAGQPCAPRFSTRLILVHYPSREDARHVLGLLAQSVTDTRRIGDGKLQPSGMNVPGSSFLGQIAIDEKEMVRLIRISELLPDNLKAALFQEQPAQNPAAGA